MLLTGKIKNCITIETPKGIPYTAEVTDIVRGESQVDVYKRQATDSALCKSSRICKSICDPDGKCRYVFCASAKIKKWKKRGRVYDNYKSDGSV